MLQSIHDRSQGWIIWIIFGFLILAFGLWGVTSYLGINEQPTIAVVGHIKITQNQYQRALQEQRQRFQQMLGANYDPKLFDTPAIRRNIAEQLISDAVVKSFMSDSGMKVSERQVGELIVGVPQFQKDGKFSQALFDGYLRSQGLSQDQLIAKLADNMMHTQLSRGIEASGIQTPKEAEYESRLLNQKRDVDYMRFAFKDFTKGVKVSDKEIEDYYKANTQSFMTNAQVAVGYIDLSAKTLADQLNVSDKEVRDYYEQNKGQYVAPEQRRASHILIQVPKGADAATDKKAKAKAEDILKKIRAGANFAAMAKKYSQDVGSAKNGGDLGYFVAGTMAKPFDDKVFSMKKGQVSGLVRTQYGYHIIKLTDIKQNNKSFSQVKKQVTEDYKKREGEKQYYDLSDKLANLAYESSDSLQPAADQTGLKVQHTDLFDRSAAKGILANPKVLKEIFSEDAISTRENEVVDLGQEHMVVIRVKNYIPAKVKPLAQVRSEVKSILTATKAKQDAKQKAEAVLAKIQKGESAATLAAASHVKWHQAGLVTRKDRAKVDPDILNRAFTLPKSDKTVSGMAELSDGDVAIVVVNKVEDGKADKASAEKNIQSEAQQDGQLAYNQFVDYLKSQADITRHFDLLK